MNIENELFDLKNELVKMGTFVENNLRDTFKGIADKDRELLKKVARNDIKTDEFEKEIEDRSLRILVTLSPKAGDFRVVTSVLKMITDLERIGDQTEDIAEICEDINFEKMDFELPLLKKMFDTVGKMLSDSIDAFVSGDIDLVKNIDAMDDIVDDTFLELRVKVVGRIKEGYDPELQLDLIQIGKYVERIGDHAENIAEWVVYENTGTHPYFERTDL
ncbi:MAG: phosphate signaling complex protein PhoU [Ezakiella sp.]|nr:phosphate signaling complex protein PhoU [Ezakiella sp.]MDD7471288.1 phosphate signaling complex protein PhoU [Bacillota bacterium]MDY3923617.1 phosphate signaling complex protein PhoU [Ezakiella sp.]